MQLFRKWWFYLILIIILIPLALLAVLLTPNSQTPAFIQSSSGIVEVDQGAGYLPAAEGMELSESDKVRTGVDSTAIIVLYEHIIIRLEGDSEVAIAELSDDNQMVRQESGSVWTKVARLGGKEDYVLSTPTTTATVRGTGFRVQINITPGVDYSLLVGEGSVQADDLWCYVRSDTLPDPRCGNIVRDRTKFVLINGTYVEQNLTDEDYAAIREQLQLEIAVLQDLRLRAALKNDLAMSIARNTYGATDEDVAEFLIDIDEGRRSEDAVRENAPIETADLERFFAYNAAIRDVKRTLEAYS